MIKAAQKQIHTVWGSLMQKAKTFLIQHRELVAYAAAGVLTTVVNYITYSVLTVLCGMDLNLSNIISWSVSVITAFFTNKAFVFQNKDWSAAAVLREGALFVGSRLLSGAVGFGLFPLLMRLGVTQSVFGVPGFAAKFISECIALVLSYFLSKYVVFKKSPPDR